MDYKTIEGRPVKEYVERRSRFIAIATRIATVDEGLDFIKDVKKEYKEATHYPYAIVSSPEHNSQKLSDDGEPQGTSAAPILGAIKGRGFMGVALCVVRYFGGVKLGAGGLSMAYGKAAKMCLDEAIAVDAIESSLVKVKLDYDVISRLEKRLKPFEKIVDREFSSGVTLTIASPDVDQLTDTVMQLTSGKAEVQNIGKDIIFY